MHVLNPEERNPVDWFYAWKFDQDGNVRQGFSYQTLLDWYWEGVKPTGTRGCHTVSRMFEPPKPKGRPKGRTFRGHGKFL